jgi:hypothetical protein
MRKPGDPESDVPGGHAAERLREFIDQRFPGGVPSPLESADAGEGESNLLMDTVEALIAAQRELELRVARLEQTVAQLAANR